MDILGSYRRVAGGWRSPLAAGLVCCLAVGCAEAPPAPVLLVAETCSLSHGVALAGAEFGENRPGFSNLDPGKCGQDYVYPGERTIRYFAAAGVKLFRIPFRWERLQPTLGEKLDPAELKRLATVVDWAGEHGCHVVLDLHNYGRYRLAERRGEKPTEYVLDDGTADAPARVTRAHLADFWRRLATEFAAHPAVAAYGLMNEPHDLGRGNWKIISQAAVDAVRTVDSKKLILVCGDGWGNATRFAEINGRKAWIKDPAGRVGYEAHCYLDHDYSGKYALSYGDELARDPELAARPERRLAPFVTWCRENGVCGFVGEYGVPQGDPRWVKLGGDMLAAMKAGGLTSSCWAAGEWWGEYPLSIHPRDNFSRPAPLEKLVVAAANAETLPAGDAGGGLLPLAADPRAIVGGPRLVPRVGKSAALTVTLAPLAFPAAPAPPREVLPVVRKVAHKTPFDIVRRSTHRRAN